MAPATVESPKMSGLSINSSPMYSPFYISELLSTADVFYPPPLDISGDNEDLIDYDMQHINHDTAIVRGKNSCTSCNRVIHLYLISAQYRKKCGSKSYCTGGDKKKDEATSYDKIFTDFKEETSTLEKQLTEEMERFKAEQRSNATRNKRSYWKSIMTRYSDLAWTVLGVGTFALMFKSFVSTKKHKSLVHQVEIRYNITKEEWYGTTHCDKREDLPLPATTNHLPTIMDKRMSSKPTNGLFVKFLVTQLDTTTFKPAITFKWVPKGKQDARDDADDLKIQQFCYPESNAVMDTLLNSITTQEIAHFSFVLTNSLGGKTYAYCKLIEQKYERKLKYSINSLLLSLLTYPISQTALSTEIKASANSSHTENYDFLYTQPASIFEHISYDSIARMRPEHLMKLFEALLCESRVILCSSIGILESSLKSFYQQPTEEVYLYNLDKAEFMIDPGFKSLLPVHISTYLEGSLKKILRSDQFTDNNSFDVAIRKPFYSVLYHLFQNYPSFMVRNGASFVFNKDQLIESNSGSTKKLLETLVCSQMIEMFFNEKEAEFTASDDLNCSFLADARLVVDKIPMISSKRQSVYDCPICMESTTSRPSVIYQDNTLHQDCFRCKTCSTGLKGLEQEKIIVKRKDGERIQIYCADCRGNSFFTKLKTTSTQSKQKFYNLFNKNDEQVVQPGGSASMLSVSPQKASVIGQPQLIHNPNLAGHANPTYPVFPVKNEIQNFRFKRPPPKDGLGQKSISLGKFQVVNGGGGQGGTLPLPINGQRQPQAMTLRRQQLVDRNKPPLPPTAGEKAVRIVEQMKQRNIHIPNVHDQVLADFSVHDGHHQQHNDQDDTSSSSASSTPSNTPPKSIPLVSQESRAAQFAKALPEPPGGSSASSPPQSSPFPESRKPLSRPLSSPKRAIIVSNPAGAHLPPLPRIPKGGRPLPVPPAAERDAPPLLMSLSSGRTSPLTITTNSGSDRTSPPTVMSSSSSSRTVSPVSFTTPSVTAVPIRRQPAQQFGLLAPPTNVPTNNYYSNSRSQVPTTSRVISPRKAPVPKQQQARTPENALSPRRLNKTCHRCKLELTCTIQLMMANGKYYHVDCFVCAKCQRPLQQGEYYFYADSVYHISCASEVVPSCAKCNNKIHGKAITSDDPTKMMVNQYHEHCFTAKPTLTNGIPS
eukprot:gene420-497_t